MPDESERTEMLERQLERIEHKLDQLLALETRVATLEVRVGAHDDVAREVAGLRNAAGLREELARVTGRVEALEKVLERRQGMTDGVKLVWLALAGTPAECREKIERYRASGIALPIVTPRGGGPDPRQRVVDAIRACAP